MANISLDDILLRLWQVVDKRLQQISAQLDNPEAEFDYKEINSYIQRLHDEGVSIPTKKRDVASAAAKVASKLMEDGYQGPKLREAK